MYRTYNKWKSAQNSFYKIVKKLPLKLINNDTDLSKLADIICKNLNGALSNYRVYTESKTNMAPYYIIRIYENNDILDIYPNNVYNLLINFIQQRFVKLECYYPEIEESLYCIFEKKGKNFIKFRVQYSKDNVTCDYTLFDSDGNILSKIVMNNDQITQDVYSVEDGESTLINSYIEFESKENKLLRK